MKKYTIIPILFIIFYANILHSQSYLDSFISYNKEQLYERVSSMTNAEWEEDGKYFKLIDSQSSGTLIFLPDTSDYLFNRGLPSWNGHVFNENSAFKIFIRFYNDGVWSNWLTAGYWKNHIWGSYGATSYTGGEINIDYVKLNSYHQIFQFSVAIGRISTTTKSPQFSKLSIYLSDSRTTDNINYTELLNDKPAPIFIDTDHYYQYDLDDAIGASICSPTTVSMILRSFSINVDPVEFARATKDPYWGIFGVWPRVVQNAHEYGLDGAVTRYRNWSDCYDVLSQGGRIGMSLGPPLYSGHLIMLAGFDENGNPLVHDSARRDGYKHLFNKDDLGRSWFAKGGIAYTFFIEDSSYINEIHETPVLLADNFQLGQNFPNPFNGETSIPYQLNQSNNYQLQIFDIRGRILSQHNIYLEAGPGIIKANTANLGLKTSGVYILVLTGNNSRQSIKINYLK